LKWIVLCEVMHNKSTTSFSLYYNLDWIIFLSTYCTLTDTIYALVYFTLYVHFSYKVFICLQPYTQAHIYREAIKLYIIFCLKNIALLVSPL
jgi:hypothetical protein